MERQENLDTADIEHNECDCGEQHDAECTDDCCDCGEELDISPESFMELQERYMRLAAEYDNFRKRTAREREVIVSDTRGYTVLQLLPLLDDLERAAAQQCNDEAYAQGIQMIVKQWHESLGKLGVSEIEAQGKPFDPNLHNAVMHSEDESQPANTVAEVFRKGYIHNERVIRPSMVKTVN